jgi:hypothetical protein
VIIAASASEAHATDAIRVEEVNLRCGNTTISRVAGSGTGAVNPGGTAQRSNPWQRWLVAVIALAALILAVPAIPAMSASLAAMPSVTDSAGGGAGTVTVTSCSRGLLLANWQCRGTFEYADPMAQSWVVTANVVLANDPRHYDRGTRVDASLRPGTHSAYLWGNSYAAEALVLLLGFVLCALAGGMLLLTRRRVSTWVTACVLFLGIACLTPTIGGLWFPTASSPSSSSSSSVPPTVPSPARQPLP